ncbi:PREDICTED: exosome complex component RRP41 [Cyphomyrmex costatus]|uniref:Putative exosome complex component RRP41 n=1 Tax=Cyphomyrmex costatus TaxID=456900 RepID=A0A195CVV1_9HYME|nr:PREDICTED: exosome complex component RRP41 [Cyphomyrmex costatus]XP_018393164.1 PREDICTED: exosome complex component RRP41 [Cyphomyrmex costatus]KYN04813.1 Exosome complex exonuclease RRP41 [Cyphomyrmex costatus]
MELDQEIDQGGLRVDGRRALELRQIRIRMGVFGQADGSAYIEHGNTKVLAAVYGPRQSRSSASRNSTKAIINCQYSMAVFSFTSGERKRRPRGDWKSQERSAQLRHAMEAIIHLKLYPRSQIDVFVEVLQVDGSDYCASVNAATLALIDAGIPIKNYAIGCSITLVNKPLVEDKTSVTGVLDANYVEECSPGVTLSVVALSEMNNDVEVDGNGLIVVAHGAGQRLHLSCLEALKQRALKGCQDVKNILDHGVRHHLTANLLPSFLHNSLD